MFKRFSISFLIYSIFLFITSCTYILVRNNLWHLFILVPIFLYVNTFAGFLSLKSENLRLRVIYHGAVVLSSLFISTLLSVFYHLILAIFTIPDNYMVLVWSLVYCFAAHFLTFWTGIIFIYTCSMQLGIRQRVLCAILALIPIVNLGVLLYVIYTVYKEVKFETDKEKLNEKRAKQRICKTKYPILMVHGFFFRDYKYFNYWGRIPKELKTNGAEIYYGNHQSALRISESAEELSVRIKEIIKETGAEKLNIIAHSKGGLDCRYAISKLDIAPYIASLTTINTPHRGCFFADYMLKSIPKNMQNKIAKAYNKTLTKLGDTRPDFLAAAADLTEKSCEELNKELTYFPDNIYCQSFGSVIKKLSSGKFPFNISYQFVKKMAGENDGLVNEDSFSFGEKYTLLRKGGKNGISHGDIIDINRTNLKNFDVREFYVELVADLKNKGL